MVPERWRVGYKLILNQEVEFLEAGSPYSHTTSTETSESEKASCKERKKINSVTGKPLSGWGEACESNTSRAIVTWLGPSTHVEPEQDCECDLSAEGTETDGYPEQ